ncbi:YcaO-like family protein [Streptomyces sp. NPDC051104]|uniref:YcaO-like family protein n=1 Tax=Streptomyces sp. NPDC051104 TaxID=3155044 RepID=UPI0034134C4D
MSAPDLLPADVCTLVGVLETRYDAQVTLLAGHDRSAEAARLAEAAATGTQLLSVRLWASEVEIGPLWTADSGTGCPVCQVTAHLRTRGITAPPPVVRGGRNPVPAHLADLRLGLELVAETGLEPGEVVLVSRRGSSRHRVPRGTGCPACGTFATTDAGPRDAAPLLDVDLRQAEGPDLTLPTLRQALFDTRYGPVVGIQPVPDSPASLVAAVHARHHAAKDTAGYGRGRTMAAAARLALLERLERAGSEALVRAAEPLRASFRELPGRALDPRRLGHLTVEQYAHPACRVDPFDEEAPLRWIPARVWGSAERSWVPLEAGSYHVPPEPMPGKRWGRVLYESSNGCALGASLDEAALHALLEVAERDAFLLTWWAARPVPRIDWSSVADDTSQALRAAMRRVGYEVHLCVITQDVPIPAVWALALNPASGDKYSLTTAAAHPDPLTAIRAAVTELAPLVLGNLVVPDRSAALRLREDPWNVTDLDHHIQWYSVPESRVAFEPFLSTTPVPLADAFPDQPARRTQTLEAACADMRDRFRAAGLDEILVVDQTGLEHRRTGLHAVRVVVPGATPLCFGFANQRVFGLPRLEPLLGAPGAPLPDRISVHPFP